MPLPLVALFIAAFAFGTTEFVIAGLLPQVAEGLSVTIPQAGYLVTGYALGIAIGGPLMTIVTGAVPRRTLLISLALVFCAGQVACALAPGFASMLAVRVAIAVAHGVFFGVAMVVAVSLVGPDKRGMAVAFVLAGLTVSNVVGVPVGAAIGAMFGWRATFWAMFGLGVVATLAMIALLPQARGAAPAPAGLAREVRVLGRQQVWTSLIMMQMLMIAQFVPFTYIAPLLTDVTGLSPSTVPLVLLANGVGATLGVFAGGRIVGARLMPALVCLFAAQSLVLAAMVLAAPHAAPMVAVVTVWGCICFVIGTPIQTRILGWTADAPNLASSLIPAGFNVGIALAATIGSLLLDAGYGYRSLPVLGVGSMLVAALVAALSWRAERRSSRLPPAPAGA
jgi:DHA1 family inner membrane transport protein